MLDIRHVAVAVNKIGLIAFSGERFTIRATTSVSRSRLASARPPRFRCRHVSGEGITTESERMRWYDGPTLLDYLESNDAEWWKSTIANLVERELHARGAHTYTLKR